MVVAVSVVVGIARRGVVDRFDAAVEASGGVSVHMVVVVAVVVDVDQPAGFSPPLLRTWPHSLHSHASSGPTTHSMHDPIHASLISTSRATLVTTE